MADPAHSDMFAELERVRALIEHLNETGTLLAERIVRVGSGLREQVTEAAEVVAERDRLCSDVARLQEEHAQQAALLRLERASKEDVQRIGADLVASVASLQSDVQRAREEAADLARREQAALADGEVLRTAIRQRDAELAESGAFFEKANAQRDEALAVRADAERRLATIEGQLEAAELAADIAVSRSTRVADEFNAERARFEAAVQEVEAARSLLEARLRTAEEDLAQTLETRRGEQVRKVALETELAAVQSAVKNASGQLDETAARLRTAEEDLARALEARRGEQARIIALETQLAAVQNAERDACARLDEGALRLRAAEEALARAREARRSQQERISVLETELADAQRAAQTASGRLDESAAAAMAERDRLREAAAAAAQSQAQIVTRLEAANVENNDLRAVQDRMGLRVGELERELQAALESEGRLTRQLREATAGGDAERDQLRETSAALERQLAELTRRTGVVVSERDALREACTAGQQRITALDEQLRHASDALRTGDQAQADLGRALSERDELQRRAAEVTEERDEAADRAATAESELRRWRETASSLTTRVADLERQSASGEEAARRMADLEEKLRAADVSFRDIEEKASVEAAERERLSAEKVAIEAHLSVLTAELHDARAAVPAPAPDLTGALAETEAKYQMLERAREEDRRTLTALTQELGDLREHYERRIIELKRREEPAARGAAPRPAAAPASAPADSSRFILLDDERLGQATASQLSRPGWSIQAVAPHPDQVLKLGDHDARAIAVNLALPKAWSTIRMVRRRRALGPSRLFGYIVAPPSPTGAWLGSIDFTVTSAAPETLVEHVRRLAPEVQHALLVSDARDVSTALNKQLDKIQVTCAVARDRAQAVDFARASPPNVMLVHLGANSSDAFRAVGMVQVALHPAPLPILFVFDEKPILNEESVLSGGARTITRPGNLSATDLAETLASAFQRLG